MTRLAQRVDQPKQPQDHQNHNPTRRHRGPFALYHLRIDQPGLQRLKQCPRRPEERPQGPLAQPHQIGQFQEHHQQHQRHKSQHRLHKADHHCVGHVTWLTEEDLVKINLNHRQEHQHSQNKTTNLLDAINDDLGIQADAIRVRGNPTAQ